MVQGRLCLDLLIKKRFSEFKVMKGNYFSTSFLQPCFVKHNPNLLFNLPSVSLISYCRNFLKVHNDLERYMLFQRSFQEILS